MRNRNIRAGFALLAAVLAFVLLAPILYPGDPQAMGAPPLLRPAQDWRFPIGTDVLGRDLAAEIAHGGRITLTIGLLATLCASVPGIAIGATAGYFQGWADDVLTRLMEIFQTIPAFLLLVTLAALMEPSILSLSCGIALISWSGIARIVRSEVRALRQREFVQAARGIGYGHYRIVFQEILPNAMPAIIVVVSTTMASSILLETAISFLGLGNDNLVSWGSMIGDGRDLLRSAWYLTAMPGLAIVLVVLSLNLLADGLTQALDPRLGKAA